MDKVWLFLTSTVINLPKQELALMESMKLKLLVKVVVKEERKNYMTLKVMNYLPQDQIKFNHLHEEV